MNIKKYLHWKKSSKPVYSSEHVSFFESLGEDAYVGWVVITSISITIAIVLIVFAGRLFFLVQSGRIVSPQQIVSSPSRNDFDQKGMDNLVASFSAKASSSVALLKGYDGPPDPSQ
jgi:hypothetical protein